MKLNRCPTISDFALACSVISPFILIIKWLWPESIPFGIFEFWRLDGIIDGVIASWPIFVWCSSYTLTVSMITRNSRRENSNAEIIFKNNSLEAVIAGVVEEIIFRWILFYATIILVKISNFLFFGFLGFGIAEIVHNNVMGPLTVFFSFGKASWLMFGNGWVVGAAIILTNSKFRDGHAYLGLIGYVNSWFCGLFFFWITLKYGLPAAILSHFIYDFLIGAIRYADMVVERKTEFAR